MYFVIYGIEYHIVPVINVVWCMFEYGVSPICVNRNQLLCKCIIFTIVTMYVFFVLFYWF